MEGWHMTRETKVGLLVGLGAIVLIGLIVTDHLAVQEGDQVLPLLTPDLSTRQESEPQLIDDLPRNPRHQSARQPLVSPPRAMRLSQTIQSPPGNKGYSPPSQQIHAVTEPQTNPTKFSPHETPPKTISRPPASPTIAGQQKLARNTIGDQPRRYHNVRPNESLYGIAEQYYGNGTLFTLLIEANPRKIMEGGHIREGVRLYVPPQPRLQTSQIHPQPAHGNPHREYTVVENDTLWRIAANTLGDPNRHNEIFLANRDKLKNADDLKAGQRLRLPTR